MWKDQLPRERLALVGLAALTVFAVTFAVVRGQRQPAPIIFQDLQLPVAKGEAQATIVVHATGAVRSPGLLHLSSDKRVDDAIKAAGGTTSDADLENINLAAKLVDGSQLFVPHKSKPAEADRVADAYKGGTVDAVYSAAPSGGTTPHRGAAKKSPRGQVSLNTGSESDLESLPGVGPSTAQKILEYRQGHGGFSSIDELMAVKGIGPKKLAAMRKFLRL